MKGGTITIEGGTVTANGDDGVIIGQNGSGIGGGADGSGGAITISGGTVNANSILGSSFSTTSSGKAFITAGSILPVYDQSSWSGIIFNGDAGVVYGNQTLATNTEIPVGKTLSIYSGKTLTIPNGVTLINRGTINNDGTITNNGTILNYGTITKPPTGGTILNAPQVDVAFAIKGGTSNVNDAKYGDTITITATLNAKTRSATINTVDFYLSNMEAANKLGTRSVSSGVATFEITLTGDKWNIGYKKIIADSGGVSGSFLDSRGEAWLTVTGVTQTVTREISYGKNTFAYGDAAVALATTPAFSPSGTITYTSSAPAVISVNESSGQIALNKAGTATITATNTVANYTNITSMVTLTVAKASQAPTDVTVSSKTPTYGGTAPAITPVTVSESAAVTYTAVTDTTSGDISEVASISGTNITIKKVGTFYVKAVIAETTNYNAKTIYSEAITVAKGDALTLPEHKMNFIATAGGSGNVNIAALLYEDKPTAYELKTITGDSGIISSHALTEAGVLTFTVSTGTVGSTATIPVKVTGANYNNATLNVKVTLTNQVSISDADLIFNTTTCPSGCAGHIITGTSIGGKIIVESGEHNIILNGVNILFSDGSQPGYPPSDGTCAFELQGNAKVNLTLTGTNTLKSGSFRAGLQVPNGTALTIEGTGSLNVTGGRNGAGIGSGQGTDAGGVIINGGTVTATGGDYSAGIGGSESRAGGTITINGGTVNTTGTIGGGNTEGRNGGSGGTITISGGTVNANRIGGGKGRQSGAEVWNDSGTFSTSSGNAFIVASSIFDNAADKKQNWNGVIFEGTNGLVYGTSITLATDAEITVGKTLTIASGKTLTINEGVTLTNNGTITVVSNGTLINNGSIKGNVPTGGGAINTHSDVAVTFAVKTGSTYGSPVATASYGDTIKITATASRIFVPKGRSATNSTVDFYLGSIATGTKLGTGSVTNNVATLDITLTGDKWNVSDKKIIADFGGVSGSLFASTGEAMLAVNKASRTINAPTSSSATANSVTLNSVTPSAGASDGTVEYGYSSSNTAPSTWQESATITGLAPNTTYYFFARVTGGANHSDATSTGTQIKTSKATLTAATVTASGTYGAFLAALTISGEVKNGSVPVSGTWSFKQADAGTIRPTVGGTTTYTATFTPTSNAGSYDTLTKSVTPTITAKALTADMIGDITGNFTYNGNAQTPTPTVTVNSNTLVKDTDYTLSYSNNTNAVTATVTVKGINNYSGTQSKNFTINPKSITPTLSVTGVTKVYNGGTTVTGATQPAISFTGTVSGETPVVTATFAYDTATVGTNKTINATNITLTISDDVNKNYALSATTASKAGAIITSAEQTVTTPISYGAIAFTYGNAAVALTSGTPTFSPSGTIKYESDATNVISVDESSGEITFRKAGTATITATNTVANYENQTSTVTITVNKAEPTVIATVKKKEATFFTLIGIGTHEDTFVLEATVKGVIGGTVPTGTVAFKNGATAIEGAGAVEVKNDIATFNWVKPNAATNITITAEFTAAESTNYTNADKTSEEFSIDKANQQTLTLTAPAGNLTYGDTGKSFSVSGGSGDGAVTYTVNGNCITVDDSGNITVKEVGNATVTATKAADDNYNVATSNTVEIEVKAATPTISWANDSQKVNYTGSMAKITAPTITLVNSEPYKGTITYSYTAKSNILNVFNVFTTSTVGLPTNAGEYTVTAHIAADGNYNQADSAEMTLTIAKIAPVANNLTFNLTAVTYDGTEKAVAVTAEDGITGLGTNITVKYGGNETAPTAAGTYAVTVNISEGENYTAKTGLELGNYTIKKASDTITWPTASGITYGAALSSSILSNGSINGTFAWSDGDDTNPTVSNSGYDVVFTPTDSDNFDYSSVTGWDGTAKTVTKKVGITVARAALTVTANNHSITYGAEPAHNDVAYSGFVNSDTVVSGTPAYTYNYSRFGDVGSSYTITPRGFTAANYTITFKTGTLTVNQKEVGLTWNDVNGRKYGDGKTVTATATGTVNSEVISVTVTDGDKTAVGNNHTATATGLTGEKVGNYKLPTTNTTTYSIAKADTFALNGSAEMIQLQANYKVELDLTTVSSYPTTPGGTPTFKVTSNSNTYNGLTSATIDTDGKTLVLVADNTSNKTADTVTVAVKDMGNYADSTITITVGYIAKTSVTITGVDADTNLVYSGSSQQGYTGTPTSDYKGEYEISYAGANGTSYTSSPTAPTNAGSYTVTFKVPDSNPTYSGSKDVSFTIGKKEVTVKPKDETVKKGEPMPSFSLIYDGLIDSETLTLSETPAFSCSASDTNTVGEYEITWSNKASVTFTGDVAKNYEITKQEISELTIAEKIFTVTIDGGGTGATGAGNHASGSTVSINAGTKGGSSFTGWTGTVGFADQSSAETTFTMPEQDVTIAANWQSNSSGGGSYTPPSNPSTVTPPDPNTPNAPTNGSTTITGNPDNNGNVTVTIPDKNITDAINAAKQQAGQNAISVTVNIQITQTANSLTAILSKPALDKLIVENVAELKIGSSLITYSFNHDALVEIQKSVTGNLTIVGAKHDVKRLSKEAQTAIGSRPVFDLTMRSGSKTITQLGKGIASVWIPYIPTADENEGRLQAAYVDANGKVSLLTASSYSKNAKALLFSTDHFSVYGVAYKAPTPAFTDTAKHWAKDDIDFVAARGLLSGTGKTTFSPDTSMTRGMFVTALGRLAGVDTKKYSNTKFTDVKADDYYSPYVAWANVNNIVNGTTATTFSPDQSITRQEMAVMLVNYSKAIGYKLPSVHAQVTFTDSASIGTWAKDAVKQMQMAGILTGKGGNKFDPTATATRAEVSAMLRRYVELVVSTETAEGWAMNESGQWMYIQDGKRTTGKKTVDGKAYEFDQYGVTTALLPERKYGVHTVKKGESFWSIARKYKVSMFELTAANGKSIFSIIYAGDELKIPQK